VSSFLGELGALLPRDLPNREECVAGAARHLELIAEANLQFNLTRIVSPREAAIKHVLDSVLPWRHFSKARHVVDAGSGAGFPGIPLALVFPDTSFTLLEATQKKARFIEAAVEALALKNVEVAAVRAEDWVKTHDAPDIVTARALAPLERAVPWFAPAVRKGAQVLLYKGPDAVGEIAQATQVAMRSRCRMRIVDEYELPDGMGARKIVELTA
jgi:16S rRNA (guanine527-N7)-methyltransferase